MSLTEIKASFAQKFESNEENRLMGKLDELCSENKKMKGELGSLTSMVVELKSENSQQKTEKLLLQRRLSQFEEEDQDSQQPTPVVLALEKNTDQLRQFFSNNEDRQQNLTDEANGKLLAQQLENNSILEKLESLSKANS